MEILRCERCGTDFEWEVQRIGRAKRYCQPCAKALERGQKHAYKVTARGRATGSAATARWLASARGREYATAYAETHRSEQAERQRRYYRTGKGRAAVMRGNCKKEGIASANAELVAYAVGAGTARCYWCGCVATEIDHVLPIALAKLFGLAHLVDAYVDALCGPCHKAKSIADRKDIDRLKRGA